VQVGHGRRELAEVAAKQAAERAYFPVWGYTTPVQAELAARLADLAPGELNRVFLTTGGGEAVESAWKVAKQYFKLIGKPGKHKVVSRAVAYHGTPARRAGDRALAPPLTCGQAEFDEMEQILRQTLTEAQNLI
jgi:adenosylmethionine-8-amino-7-oxononanoate aminotransferase